MKKMNKKYLILSLLVGIVVLTTSSFILLMDSNKEENKKLLSEQETEGMLSYTLDGQKTDIKPTKDSGYIANKIICENGSNLIWDNTNWEVEIIKLESSDICTVDFTTNTLTEGYRVSATTNVEGSIDSLSKATVENGTIIFYPAEGKEITGVSGCTGVIENNKVIVSNITSNQTCNIEIQLKTLYATLSDGVKYTVGIRGTFDRPFGASSANSHATISQGYNQTGTIYKIDNNNYYFAGNPSDNWVKFAGKYWRIIRTNSTEGTRLLYAGTSAGGKDGYINNTTYVWHSTYDNYTYVNWGNASFKSTLSSWYSSNITGNDDNMVNSVVYCNDTSYTDMTGTWSGTNPRKFGAYTRLNDSKNPSHTCGTNQFGAAAKVGMMTADEVAYAGGEYGYNSPNTYYYRNSVTSGCTGKSGDPCSVTGNNHWWTLSPNQFSGGFARVFFVYGAGSPGQLYSSSVIYSYAVRPVVTLKSSVLVSGSGTASDPFVPSL